VNSDDFKENGSLSKEEALEDDLIRTKQEHFIKLCQSYRIQHPTTTHEVAVEYVREVMADSSRIKFDWVM